jgi:hypothetical protein
MAHVSQIFITNPGCGGMSPFLQHATNTVKQCFPASKHVIYDGGTLRDFIVAHYDKDVVWAYDKLRPYSYKADLGRLCLLDTLGGWYFDISIRCVNTVNVSEEIAFLAFRDIQRYSYSSCWACSTAVMYSKPDNKALQIAIEMIVRNCREAYYGINSLCVTGPVLFGEALAASRAQSDFVFGDYLELTPNHHHKNRAFVLPDGTILAWGKPADGGDLVALGATGVNNYNVLWEERKVFLPEVPE